MERLPVDLRRGWLGTRPFLLICWSIADRFDEPLAMLSISSLANPSSLLRDMQLQRRC